MNQVSKETKIKMKRYIALFVLIAILISAIGMTFIVKRKKEIAEYQAIRQGNILKYSVDTMLLNLNTLAEMVVNGDGKINNFDEVCKNLMDRSASKNAIGSLQLAPNGVVTDIYPEQGNEAGKIDLFADPDRKTEAEWARDTGNTTLAGPYELLQGGFAAVARMPVYLENEKGEKEFWGFVVEILNMDETLQPAGLETFVRDGYDYCFWRTDPKTGEKVIICESTDAILKDHISVEVEMPNVTWHFDVQPHEGWISVKNMVLITLLILVSGFLGAGLAYHQSIEEQKKIVGKKNDLLRKSLNNIVNNIAVFRLLDEQMIPVVANREFLHFMGLTEEAFESMDVQEFLEKIHWKNRDEKEQEYDVRVQGSTSSESKWFRINTRIAADEDGTVLLYIIMDDIHEEKQREEQLLVTQQELADQIESGNEWEYHAEHDALTGLLNRKAYERITAKLNENKTPVGFVLIDIDHFKEINDDYGHDIGDQLLKKAAGILSRYVRESDYVFRFGGDEFVLLLCHAELSQTQHMAQKLHEMQNELSKDDGFPVAHFSAGMYFSREGVSEAVYRSADEALYHTKKNGRAGCTVFDHQKNVVLEEHEHTRGNLRIPKNEVLTQPNMGECHRDISEIPVITKSEDEISRQGDLAMIREVNEQIFHYFQAFLGIIDLKNQRVQVLDSHKADVRFEKEEFYDFADLRKLAPVEQIVVADRERFELAVSLETILRMLQENEKYEFSVSRYKENGDTGLYTYHFCYFRENKEQIICMVEEVTSQEETDLITEELNMHGFLRKVQNILDNQQDYFAMVHMDIVSFKAINEQIGFERGNILLKSVAESIKESSLKPVAITRGMADHFYFLIRQSYLDYKEIRRLCNQHVPFENTTLMVSMQCGIYLIDDKSIPVRYMCDKARMAKNARKKNETGCPYFVFTDEMKQEYIRKRQILESLDETVKNEEFNTYFQPIYDAKSGKMASAEALVRWIKSDGQVISPDLFIPTLEENGQISKIDMILTHFVKKCMEERLEQQKRIVPISVNLSRMDFYNEDAMTQLVEAVENAKIPKEYLRFEITESSYTDIPEQGLITIQKLRKLGAKLLIDDFGKGYSSLSCLAGHSFDIVKLDMSFIRQIGKNNRAEAVIRAAIQMVHLMNAKVTAEGVETKEQYEFLRDEDCDYIQGFYFAKPMPREAFEALLDEKN